MGCAASSSAHVTPAPLPSKAADVGVAPSSAPASCATERSAHAAPLSAARSPQAGPVADVRAGVEFAVVRAVGDGDATDGAQPLPPISARYSAPGPPLAAAASGVAPAVATAGAASASHADACVPVAAPARPPSAAVQPRRDAPAQESSESAAPPARSPRSPSVVGAAAAAAAATVSPPPSPVDAPLPEYAYHAGRRVEADYLLGKLLGRGQFGVVLAATHRGTQRRVAVKRIDKARSKRAFIESELDVMVRLRGHPNVVSVLACYDGDPAHVSVVLELCPGGELFDALVSKGAYSEAEARVAMKGVVEGVAHMHAQGIVHR